jgi:hypothetical protein
MKPFGRISFHSLLRLYCWDCGFDDFLYVEPLPNIRDGILVERLVKALRYVPDVRRCQYVVQRPKGVRRRQRLNVEYVDRRAGGPSVSTEAA